MKLVLVISFLYFSVSVFAKSEQADSEKINIEKTRRTLEESSSKVSHCYSRQAEILGTDTVPTEATILVKLTIEQSGLVKTVETSSKEVSAPLVHECIRNEIKKLKFPAHNLEGTLTVTQPLRIQLKKIQ